jgi:hypothetical protein
VSKDQYNVVKKTCVAWKAHILEEQCNYELSLQAYWEICDLTESNDPMYFTNRIDFTRVLGLANRNGESIREAENLLNEMTQDGVDDMFDFLRLLEIYVKNLNICGTLFSSKYSTNVRDVADYLEVDISRFNLNQQEYLPDAVMDIVNKNREANNRYSHLVVNPENVRGHIDESIALLNSYIEHENFVFYRNLAIGSLDLFQGQH